MTIPIAHDFSCLWCWAGMLQAMRLKREFGVELEWWAFEEYPDGMDFPEPSAPETPSDKPKTPSRLALLLAADRIPRPAADRPRRMRTHNAHEAVEHFKGRGDVDGFVEAIYRAHFERGVDVNDLDVLRGLAEGHIEDLDDMLAAIRERRYADKIVAFDDQAHAIGIYNTPTFCVGDQRLAEQPYSVIASAVAAVCDRTAGDTYSDLVFPAASTGRPYTFANMVATIDGKTVSGDRGDDVVGPGSRTDHELMRRIEAGADAAMVGAGTLRATSPRWAPKSPVRIAVTESGNLNYDSEFFKSAKSAFVACFEGATFDVPAGVTVLRAGQGSLDVVSLMRQIRELGVNRLLVLGGSHLNGSLLAGDVVDELFLTIAPKVKIGSGLPTYAEGPPLPRDGLHLFDLVSSEPIGDEVFLRYRRKR